MNVLQVKHDGKTAYLAVSAIASIGRPNPAGPIVLTDTAGRVYTMTGTTVPALLALIGATVLN